MDVLLTCSPAVHLDSLATFTFGSQVEIGSFLCICRKHFSNNYTCGSIIIHVVVYKKNNYPQQHHNAPTPKLCFFK